MRVIGIDPNDDMLSTARGTTRSETAGTIEYRHGNAEATGLPAGIAIAVTAFQAFHWFKGHEALAEFHRVLASDGSVALMWNDRDEAIRFRRLSRYLTSTCEGEAIANSCVKQATSYFIRALVEPQTFNSLRSVL